MVMLSLQHAVWVLHLVMNNFIGKISMPQRPLRKLFFSVAKRLSQEV